MRRRFYPGYHFYADENGNPGIMDYDKIKKTGADTAGKAAFLINAFNIEIAGIPDRFHPGIDISVCPGIFCKTETGLKHGYF